MQIKTSTGLIIIFATAVIIGGSALTYSTFSEKEILRLEAQSLVRVPKNTTNANITTQSAIANKEETTYWKTYTNNKYSFSIKYPKDWGYEEQNTGSRVTVRFNHLKSKVYPVEITCYSNPNNLAWDEFFNGQNAPAVEGYEEKFNIVVDGKPAIKLVGVPGLILYTWVIIPADKAFIVITSNVGTISNSMLSTFKFLP